METTLPLDRLISLILHEHHLVQSAVNSMVESINEKQAIDINDLEDARVLLEREMNKITEVGQRITLLTSRVQSLTSLLGDLTDDN